MFLSVSHKLFTYSRTGEGAPLAESRLSLNSLPQISGPARGHRTDEAAPDAEIGGRKSGTLRRTVLYRIERDESVESHFRDKKNGRYSNRLNQLSELLPFRLAYQLSKLTKDTQKPTLR